MEKIYDSSNSCKASGTVTKIIGGDYTINKCGISHQFKLNDGTRDYVVRGIEKNTTGYGTGCEDQFYAFSGGEVPKVGDEMYVVAQYGDSYILDQGKEVYNKYENLSECTITYDGPPSQYAYLWADKCKVSGKIAEVKKLSANNCGFDLQFEVQNNGNTYFFSGVESVYFEKYGSYCLGRGESSFPIVTYGQQGGVTNIYYPSNGDNIYAILDMSNNTLLKYGEEAYNRDSDIPVCEAEINPEKYSSVVGISDAEIKTIMDKAETELKKLFSNKIVKSTQDQAIKQQKETITPVLIKEKTVTMEPKTTPIPTTTAPKKNTISTSTPKKEEIKQAEVIVSTGSEIQETVSFGSEIKEEKIEVIIQKAEPIKLGFYNSPDSYILFSGIIVLSILLYFVFKKLKAKK